MVKVRRERASRARSIASPNPCRVLGGAANDADERKATSGTTIVGPPLSEALTTTSNGTTT